MAPEPSKAPKEDVWDKDFGQDGADIVLRSSNGVLHGTRKSLLSRTSTVFRDMLEVGTEDQDKSQGSSKRQKMTDLPTLDLPEPCATICLLLLLADPAAADKATSWLKPGALDLDDFAHGLIAADKVRLVLSSPSSPTLNACVAVRLRRHPSGLIPAA